MSVYTKRGDRGQTGLYTESGKERRVSKNSYLIEAIGSVDEANSYVGICIADVTVKTAAVVSELEEVQRDLFTIGSILAGANLVLKRSKIVELEKMIDKMEGELPVLAGFILPGGTKLASELFFARALVRRAERAVVTCLDKKLINDDQPLIYLNRLSDFLFILARKVNFDAGVKELNWK